MGHLGPWYESVSPENKYLFNGIELEDASDMNVYMAVFRTYDPAIGRWWQVDPRYDVQVSPYAGFGNNPIRLADPLGDTTYLYSALDENGKPMYGDSELGAIILAAAMIDARNGLESHYVITTQSKIKSGSHSLDKEVDLVYEVTNAYYGDGPGRTWQSEREMGEGFMSGVINPDHPTLRNKGTRSQQLFNAGIALSHEQNTHGFSNKIDLIGGGNTMVDDHVYDRLSLDTGRRMPFYTGPTAPRHYKLLPEHTLTQKNLTKSMLILGREKIKRGIHSGSHRSIDLIHNTKQIQKAANR
jgi:RHS repeat-associated protein